MKQYWPIFVLIIFFAMNSCQKEPEPKVVLETKILGHRGSGTTELSGIQENTLTSVANAFENLHGAEVDIQCSKDGTIWLYHDSDLPSIALPLICIPQSTDSELDQFASQHEDFTLTRLEEVFALMTQISKVPCLSLDVKGHFSSQCFEGENAPESYFELMAASLTDLLDRYNVSGRVMVETDYQNFLDLMIAHEPRVECYLLGYSNFNERMEVALSKKYHGISYNYNNQDLSGADILSAHQKGLKVQLWTLGNETDFLRVLDWNPDFIQAGYVDLGQQFMD